MELSRIGVHESTSIDFPFDVFAEEFADVGAELVPIDDETEPATLHACDAFVTFTHRDALLEADPVWIHTTQAGVDGFPTERYADRDVALTRSTGLHGDSVGETTVALVLALARRVHDFVANQRERTWAFPEWNEAFTVAGEPICVVGLGTVGRGIARRASGLDMRVTGVKRTPEPVEGVETVYSNDELTEAIADARFVALAVPLTDETEGMIGERELGLMREDAYLVNVARGAVVDEDALIDALGEGAIAGAALDVFETEPLPEDSPLWDMEDVIVTPHAAVADRTFYVDVADLVRRNVERLAAGEELVNRVV